MTTTNCYQNMLAALADGDQPSSRIDACENVVLAELRARGALGRDEGAHVEYGCVEHGIVHVYGEKVGWLEIDPATGEVSVLG